MKYHAYWIQKSSCFEFFGNKKYGLFLSQKVDGNMIFTDCCKVLVLNILAMGYGGFFEPKSWWKDDIFDIYWLINSLIDY